MFAPLTLLAYDREDLMVAALAALVVAGAVLAIGAWILLLREARRRTARERAGQSSQAELAEAGKVAEAAGEEPQA
jgi:hypothetical protein